MELNKNHTISTASAGVIDEGLRSHMNRVYGTLSSGLLGDIPYRLDGGEYRQSSASLP